MFIPIATDIERLVCHSLSPSNIKNARNRARKHGAETLNAMTQALCIPLRDLVKGYKTEWRRLHPFERVVADLTARARQKRDGLNTYNCTGKTAYNNLLY